MPQNLVWQGILLKNLIIKKRNKLQKKEAIWTMLL